jgi:putative aldouronate transport system substrate-binding protein
MFDKYNLSTNSFTDIYDMGSLLARAKAGEGANFYPLTSDYSVLERMSLPTENINATPVLASIINTMDPSQSSTEIVSRFETSQFASYVRQMREYYLAGYINPDASSSTSMMQAWEEQKASGQFLISSRIASPFYELYESDAYGYTEETRDVLGIITTNKAQNALHAISAVSRNPEVALQVLNLVNSDSHLHNLLARGVEGIHYNLERGKIRFTAEKENYNVWAAGLGRLSDLIPTVSDPDIAKWKAGISAFNNAEASPLIGWTFNHFPVESEINSLNSIVEHYYHSLICGAVNPEIMLPEFIQALKGNGLDVVVAEANNQLRAFLAS